MTRRSPVWRQAMVLGTTIVATLLLPPLAAADDGPPDSAVSQYVETVPTSDGSVAVGTGKAHHTPLSATVEQQLDEAGSTGVALKAVASSSSYGAPTTKLTASRATPLGRRAVDDPEPGRASLGGALGAAVTATGTTTDARLLALLAVLAVTTVIAIAARARASR